MDEEGQSPPYYAIRSENMDCLTYMLKERPVNLHVVDQKGQNLIEYAFRYKLWDQLDFLVEAGVPYPNEIKIKVERRQKKNNTIKNKQM